MSETRPSADGIHFAPKDRPLRQDVNRLGAALGDLLREIAPPGVFAIVERARLAARRRRRGDVRGGAELARLLDDLEPAVALEVVRAFSAYFGLVNTAEQVHRLRRRADYRRAGERQAGSLAATAAELVRRGTTAEEVAEALEILRVEPVFTAHPTEAVRRTLLKKDQRLAKALLARSVATDAGERAELTRALQLEIASAWQTEEQLPGRPSVADEVEHVLFFVSEVLFPMVPKLERELERALASAYGTVIPVRRSLVRFASWVGGDMDGNPNVGAHTIRETLGRHLELALRCYRAELRALHEPLSQSTTRVAVEPCVTERVARYRELLPAQFEAVPRRYEGMPYRQLLWLMDARLIAKGRGEAGGYGAPAELLADLDCMATSLGAHGGARAGLEPLLATRARVETFGFHLASLDVRQDALVHREVVGALLGEPDFAKRAAAERAARIAEVLAQGAAAKFARLEPAADATLEVFRALGEALATYGAEALGPYIISMAKGADDALAVLLLARAAGCVDGRGEVPLDVVPLLETVDDLEAGPDILGALARDAAYAAHLASRGGRQMVMLGYSDSGKDGGIAASRVALQRAQERLVAVAKEAGLELVLFHGRGGSISRGGSKPRAGILAAPPGALGGRARATEQGEIVGDKFGLEGIATRTLELTLGALLERTAGGDPAQPSTDEQRQLAATLLEASRAKYSALVHQPADFAAFFQGMTPIDVIERLAIGSRPSRRREMRGVADLRAIPWVFAWTQCRALVPGWFGMGAGLRAVLDAHGIDDVRRMAQGWPFLRNLLADVEMVLAKSDLEIAARYAELAGDSGARHFPTLCEDHRLAVACILEIGGARELLERDPTLQRSIRLRNPYVDPMSYVQIDLLHRWRAGDRQDRELERVLVQTVRGIARGLRNTG